MKSIFGMGFLALAFLSACGEVPDQAALDSGVQEVAAENVGSAEAREFRGGIGVCLAQNGQYCEYRAGDFIWSGSLKCNLSQTGSSTICECICDASEISPVEFMH